MKKMVLNKINRFLDNYNNAAVLCSYLDAVPVSTKDDTRLICPISMRPIQDLAIDSHGISYERSEIEKFISRFKASPMTGKEMRIEDLKKESESQRIEWQISNIVVKTGCLRYRLILTVNCFVNFKFEMMSSASLELTEQKLLAVPYDFKEISEWWPQMHDRRMVSDIVWSAFPDLRSMVYGEFIRIQNAENENYNEISSFTRGASEKYWKEAVFSLFFSSKTEQIDAAIEKFINFEQFDPSVGYNVKYTHFENEANKAARRKRWQNFFGEADPSSGSSNAVSSTTVSHHPETSGEAHRAWTSNYRSDGLSHKNDIYVMYGCPQGGHYC